MDFRSVAPAVLQTSDAVTAIAQDIAGASGARITRTESVEEGVRGCDFLYTDVWVSMGEPESVWKERIELLSPYQVNSRVMELTGKPECKFLHCLPAFHDRQTAIGEDIFQRFGLDAMEVSDDVFASPASVVFDEAENRVHTIKAVMVATIAGI
jgi:ornithine carbamoyltransferase